MTKTIEWVKCRGYSALVLACVFCLLLGTGLAMIIGRTKPTTVLLFGGNGDHCADQFKAQLDATGRSAGYNIIRVCYNADIAQGKASAADGVTQGRAAWDDNCGDACQLWGFSWGTEPAAQLALTLGVPGSGVHLWGGPQHAAGIWHHWGVVSGVPPLQVEYWINTFGPPTNTIPPPGTKVFFSTADPYGNAAPQCGNPAALGALQLNEHAVQPIGGERIWTDRFGLEIHEFDVGAYPTIASGVDPSPAWQGCPWFDWNRSEEFDGSRGLPGMFPPIPPGLDQGQPPLPVPGLSAPR